MANNTLTDIKLNKAQLSKVIQPVAFLGNMTAALGKETLMKFAVPLAKYILPQIATRAISSVMTILKEKCLEVGWRLEL